MLVPLRALLEKSMKAISMAVVGFAFCASTLESSGAEVCAGVDDLTTLQTAAVQQLLMVSAFVCNEVPSYNAFVLGHQGELQKSDLELQRFFVRLNTRGGIDDYHAYKTRLANTYSLLSVGDKQGYCAVARAAFERSETGDTRTLREFVLREPLGLTLGYSSCGEPIAGRQFMITPMVGRPAAVVEGATSPISRGDYFYDGRSFRRLHRHYSDSFGRR
jgi:hypothetical protein